MHELNGATKAAKRLRAQEGFVLKSPDVPSVLIDLDCLSDPAEEKALADNAHIGRLPPRRFGRSRLSSC